ncbi:hypothetical protein RHMOL_Rhmol03G0171700 [Rhododendron molle]|uniref:Uncharacterized protein n=2 Tax=Rhododendron molle TaxID=49168 RepID=A0ACC0PGY0_RHOML|nr:hypothetical protein RHMOL_Rhmol03G0171700 [Rhododendron molle]KAI8564324.1 hypothetical protein RHMOL_Rhmol03G0171700 [Rhododendron molle]
MGERSTKREREEEEERSPTTPATHRQGRPPQLPVLAHHHLRRPPAHPFEKIASPSRNHRRQTHLPPSFAGIADGVKIASQGAPA